MDTGHAIARTVFSAAPFYMGIESLAQLAAYHVRSLDRFARHAFLLKIAHCRMAGGTVLNGPARLEGTRTAGSDTAFSYRLQLSIPEGVEIRGEFVIAVKPYASAFQEERMRRYYEESYRCLTVS
jgi:hypothetical protein